jgi:hypothetical protein
MVEEEHELLLLLLLRRLRTWSTSDLPRSTWTPSPYQQPPHDPNTGCNLQKDGHKTHVTRHMSHIMHVQLHKSAAASESLTYGRKKRWRRRRSEQPWQQQQRLLQQQPRPTAPAVPIRAGRTNARSN